MQPLNGKRRIINLSDTGNAGLCFSKFVDVWPDSASKKLGEFRGLQGEEKAAWIRKFCKKPVGDLDELQVSTQRMNDLVRALAKESDTPEPRCYVNDSMFVTGMGLSHPVENGFLWHPTLGVPYLPGSSVKGLIRAWAQHWSQKVDEAERLFGRSNSSSGGPVAGSVIVFDALPMQPIKLMQEIITPHDGGWRIKADTAPSDWISPNPIPFLVVAPGGRFNFAMAARDCAQEGDLALAYDYLGQALEWIGAGAKTSVGFGRFVSENGAQAREIADKKILHARAEKQREQKRIQKEIHDNRAFAKGEEVECALGRGFIVDIDSERASIDFGDGDSPESVPVKELKRV